jgi:hypothetical protein
MLLSVSLSIEDSPLDIAKKVTNYLNLNRQDYGHCHGRVINEDLELKKRRS